MRLSQKAIQEFKAICRDEFGVDLLDGKAEERALAVLDLYWLVFVEPASDSTASTSTAPKLDALESEDVAYEFRLIGS
jgi:hypothetical protein